MMQDMYTAMGISPEVYEYGEQTLVSLKDRFDEIDKTAEYNQLKVLKAMQDCRVSEACLLGTTGYGYNDIGRDTLEAVYASPVPYRGSPGASSDHLWDTRARARADEQFKTGRRTVIPRWKAL